LEVREDNHPAQHLYQELGFGNGYQDGAVPVRFLEKRL
jgi:ribosomal protein S18 acetylase RimI-like enzyme